LHVEPRRGCRHQLRHGVRPTGARARLHEGCRRSSLLDAVTTGRRAKRRARSTRTSKPTSTAVNRRCLHPDATCCSRSSPSAIRCSRCSYGLIRAVAERLADAYFSYRCAMGTLVRQSGPDHLGVERDPRQRDELRQQVEVHVAHRLDERPPWCPSGIARRCWPSPRGARTASGSAWRARRRPCG